MNGTVHALQPLQSLHRSGKPERAEVEAAVRTIIRWTGDDPDREGLVETPARLVRALEEFFCGYREDPADILQKSFEEVDGYDEMGCASVAYGPRGRVVGISKLARVVQAFARRLQIQEKLTAQIANTIDTVLKPMGVGVVIKAVHHCMTTRGVHKPDSSLVTSRMLGCFRDDAELRRQFIGLIE